MRIVFLSYILFFCLGNSVAQTTVDLEMEEFTDLKVKQATIDTNYLHPWQERVLQTTESFLRLERTSNDLLILVTCPKGAPAQVEISARPQLSEFKLNGLRTRLENLSKPPRSRLTDYAYLITAKVNGGCKNPQLKFLPQILMPDEKVKVAYEAADLKTKVQLLQKWAKEEAIPVVNHYMTFESGARPAVQEIGTLLSSEDYLRKDPVQLTVENQTYWQATNEINKQDGLVYLSKILMHIAHGEFELARRYLHIGQALPENNSLVTYYYQQLDFRLEWLFDDLRNAILIGKQWQQEGDFHGAELYFDELIESMPKLAALHFEKYYSHSLRISHRPPEEIMKNWQTCTQKVYAIDPLYAMNIPAKSRKEMYRLSLRHDFNTILSNPATVKEKLVLLADHAFDLEAYGVAAQLYAIIKNNGYEMNENKDLEGYYLYALDKIGLAPSNYEKDVVKNRFKKIDKERLEAMEASPFITTQKNSPQKTASTKHKGKKRK